MRISKQISTLALLLIVFGLSFSGAFGASINGVVTDANSNQPVESAMILAIGYDPATGDSLVYTTQSLPDGSYQIDNMVAGTFFLFAEHPSYIRASQGPFVLDPNTNLNVDFQLVPFTGLNNFVAGTVFDAQTGLPVGGATVSLAFAGAISYQTASDSAGDYRFENIIPGVYQLLASAPRYLPFFGNFPVIVEPNTQISDLDISLIPGGGGPFGTLTGVVMDSLLQTPVHPAFIELYGFDPATGDSLFYFIINNPDGSYQLDQIIPGTYTIRVHAAGYEELILNGYVINEGLNILNFFLFRSAIPGLGAISGTVVFDSSGAPVAGALIEFIPVNGIQPWTTYTNSQGFYSALVPEGDYYVSCVILLGPNLPAFYQEYYDDVHTLNEATVVTVVENGTTGGIDFGIPEGIGSGNATLSGNVTDENGLPIAGAYVEMVGHDTLGIVQWYSGYTDSSGHYQIDNVLSGIYDVTASAFNYLPQTVFAFEVLEGQNTLDFQLSGLETGTITGTVTFDSSGAPVQGAWIDFIANNGSGGFAVTNENGNYSADLPVGEYIVACHIFDPATGIFYTEYYDNVLSIAQATPVPVIANSTTSGIDFGIPEGGVNINFIIAGQVTDANFNPLENALVKVESQRFPGLDTLVFITLSDAQGFYQVEVQNATPFNIYFASAAKPGYLTEYWQEAPDIFSATPIFYTGDSLIQGIDFTLDPVVPGNNSISGNISDDFGNSLPNTFVVGSNLSTGQIHFVFSDTNGDYTLGGLHSDPFVVLFAKDSHVPEFYDDALIWENATPILAQGNVTGIDASLTPINPNGAAGMVAGTVTDLNGTALSGVLLTVKNNTGQVIGYDFTDAQGGYQIAGLENGDYAVQATKISFSSESQGVVFNTNVGNMVMADFDLEATTVSIDPGEVQETIPSKLELAQNYPNPFNPVTTISFALPETQRARLVIYNILGQAVKILVDETLPAGHHQFTWDGTNESGVKAATGIYLYTLKAGENQIVRKMLLTK